MACLFYRGMRECIAKISLEENPLGKYPQCRPSVIKIYLSAKKYKSILVPPSKKSLTLRSMRTLIYIYYFFMNQRGVYNFDVLPTPPHPALDQEPQPMVHRPKGA